MLERAFAVAHAVPGVWALAQVAAIAAGAAIVVRSGGSRRLGVGVAYAAGVTAACAGGLALGSGGAFARWIVGGAHGAHPPLEVAGFGALVGLVLAFAALAPRRGAETAVGALDPLVPALGVIQALSRLGCFAAGCDFGAPTHVPWAMRYPQQTAAFRAQAAAGLVPTDAPSTLPVHPTQLYEAALGVVMLVLALTTGRSRETSGDRAAVVLAVHALGRVVVEAFRGDVPHGALGMTTTQSLSVALVAVLVAVRMRQI
jgi:phosphatidylglycerol:prolipoprotein diacylglycerol transferase